MKWRIHSENKYLQLLIVLVVTFLFSPFLEELSGEFPFLSFALLCSIIFTLRALELKRRTFIICCSLGAVAFLSTEMLKFSIDHIEKELFTVIALTVYVFFFAAAIVLMIHKMFSSSKVSGDTIRGGICVYFLLGYLWSLFYYIIFFFDRTAFYLPERWNDVYLMYLSFATLTTLGYGDVFPVNKMAMVMTNLEAVTGQMYLAIFVARMVGLHIMHHQSEQRAD